jgi:DNA-binding Lrp family transcriptional regulator
MHDLFVKVEADDEAELTRCIVQEIRAIDGIAETRTLIGAEI